MRKRIGVYPGLRALPPVLASALTRLLPVQFESVTEVANAALLDALLVLTDALEFHSSTALPTLRCFRVVPGEPQPTGGEAGHRVQFGDGSMLDARLRRRALTHQKLDPVQAVRLQEGDEVLARVDASPVWVSRSNRGMREDVVALGLPALADGELPFQYLNDGHYLQLLPLVHFLREVTAGTGWEGPALRACLMFDDPNLHWWSYGFLDYRRLVSLARGGGFHVALATVPLDASWGTHGPTARLFRENADHLSLLIHGNDHTRAELGQVRSPEAHLRLLAQALARISRLEKATGLRVARAMAPPHGANAKPSLAAMFALGYEGACISPWSLRDWERDPDWPSTFGLEMAELMEPGFPVIPRFRLSDACETSVVISAFLGRPIIPLGHHDTVADGVELLARTAEMINSVGSVRWGSPETILRSNFSTRREGATLVVRPHSARIRVRVPPEVTALRVTPAGPGSFCVTGSGNGAAERAIEAIPVRSGEEVEIVARGLGAVNYERTLPPPFSCWGLPRRVLCEARDRAQPILHKVRRLGLQQGTGAPVSGGGSKE